MYAIRPITNRGVCVKENVNGYEISIAFDDSCNDTCKNLSRGDIRIYRISDDADMTDNYNAGDYTIPATIENIIKVNKWCKTH